MSFNREKGEFLAGLGTDYVIAPNGRWTDTPLYDEAARHALEVFRESGSLAIRQHFDDDEILVQEYPKSRKLAFLFCRKIRNEPYYYTFTWDLPPEMITELRMSGRWGYRH